MTFDTMMKNILTAASNNLGHGTSSHHHDDALGFDAHTAQDTELEGGEEMV